jgi:monofunctional glycosyltransferase
MKRSGPVARRLMRTAGLLLLSTAALQIAFLARVALMAICDPQSTSYQRTEAWRLLVADGPFRWSQTWADLQTMSVQLQRAVIASEDATFTSHSGVEWEAVEKAWDRNQRAQAAPRSRRSLASRLRGGSTISQQLAKNLLLSGERTIPRKGQELLLTWMLEATLSKRRLLELYLNHVEWGEGVFGAEAAAQHYFRVDVARLSATQAARLAVMLPAPKRFERRPGSDYLQSRASVILARMPAVALP